MKQFLITAAGVFAGLVIFLIGVPLLLIGMAVSATAPQPVPAKTVLELDLRGPLSDQSARNPLWGLARNSTSVMSIVETLHRAESDDRIKGLFVRLPEGGVEPGMADEIRQAFLRFRAAGKPIYAHSQGVYPAGFVTTTYMLGAASDQFWMQPGASLQVTGVATEDLFFKRFFDKYGVVPQYEQRREYKNAVNGFLYSDYTPAHREATLSWMGAVYQSNLAAAAGDRKADAAVLRQTLEAGPYVAEDAQRLKLIDKLGQVREAEQAMLEKAGAKDISTYDSKQPPGLDIHEMGGVRMGNDPATSLLNKWNQLHACQNVFITDGACMTSTGNQSPSILYMALTARAVNYAAEELKKGNL